MLPSPDEAQSKLSWRAFVRSRLVIIATFVIVVVVIYAGRTYHNTSTTTPAWSPYEIDMTEVLTAGKPANAAPSRPGNLQIFTVPGFFVHDDPRTDPTNYHYNRPTPQGGSVLGLVNRPYHTDDDSLYSKAGSQTQWQKFESWLNKTNENAPSNVVYKLIYMGRHGQGEHNVVEAKYGTIRWDEYYSKLPEFTDPHLTAVGIGQAQDAGLFFEQAIEYHKVPLPQSYYVSPLARCLSTAMLTFSRLELPRWRPFHAIVKENLRETLGVHTCDKRSNRTWIYNHFNAFNIEPGFTEEDTLWDPEKRETDEEQTRRANIFLTGIFNNDESSIISFTTHSGMIGAILRAISHRPFQLETGSIIAVLVKGEWN